MKINISGLMNLISDYDKQLDRLWNFLRSKVYSMSIQELNGTVNVITNAYDEYQDVLDEYKDKLDKVTQLKTILYEKNNTFKLSDGRTIQTAIIDNSNLRKLKITYEELLDYNDYKKRITEVNNSYFECNKLNYNKEKIKDELNTLNDKIQKTDFEISLLNSQEFNI